MERSYIKYVVGRSEEYLKNNTLPESVDLSYAGLFWREELEKFVLVHLAPDALTAGLVIYDEDSFFTTYCWPKAYGGKRTDEFMLIDKALYHKIKVYF